MLGPEAQKDKVHGNMGCHWDVIACHWHNVCANLSMMTMTRDDLSSNSIHNIPFHHVNVSGMLLSTCEKGPCHMSMSLNSMQC